jgi:uncharacterized protein (DUF2141 family)
MRTLTLIFAFIFSTLGFSQNSKGQTITVTIDNVLNNKGQVIFALHDNASFMKSNGLQSGASEIKDGKATITFTNVTPGTYAIIALHDENSNQRMDFEPNGMPKEAFGLSTNPMSYGPPQFHDAKFEVTHKDLDLNIRF